MPLIDVYSDATADITARQICDRGERFGMRKYLREGPIADFGCGSGAVLHELKLTYPNLQVIGIDLHPSERYDDVEYHQENFCHTSLAPESMAVVISCNIVDYCTGFMGRTFLPEELCAEVDRVLKPGGFYLLLDYQKQEEIAYPLIFKQYTSFLENRLFRKPNYTNEQK